RGTGTGEPKNARRRGPDDRLGKSGHRGAAGVCRPSAKGTPPSAGGSKGATAEAVRGAHANPRRSPQRTASLAGAAQGPREKRHPLTRVQRLQGLLPSAFLRVQLRHSLEKPNAVAC